MTWRADAPTYETTSYNFFLFYNQLKRQKRSYTENWASRNVWSEFRLLQPENQLAGPKKE